jgi:F0F1-type ATP synthase assembly protein I
MILMALKTMLFGMIGIFLVMGMIIGVISLLAKAFREKGEKEAQ